MYLSVRKKFLFSTFLVAGLGGMIFLFGTCFANAEIVLHRNLSVGDVGGDVKDLQVFLNQSTDTQIAMLGAGSIGNETSYFGARTADAVRRYQEKYGNSILTPLGLQKGTGVVGARTREHMRTLGVVRGVSTSQPVGVINLSTQAPHIDRVDPVSGGVGTKVTVHGSNLAGVEKILGVFGPVDVVSADENKVSFFVTTPFGSTLPSFWTQNMTSIDYYFQVQSGWRASNIATFVINL